MARNALQSTCHSVRRSIASLPVNQSAIVPIF